MTVHSPTVRKRDSSDDAFVRDELTRNWHSTQIWSLGRMYEADALPGYIAELDGERAGLATYCIHPGGYQCELVTISSRIESRGVGAALLDAVIHAAREAECDRLMLTTSNDNVRALQFYQKRGWRLCGIHAGSIDRARALYPDKIPLVGLNGIPVHDELELELWLDPRARKDAP
jgi:GNAT superfamily N-acetyltransferase